MARKGWTRREPWRAAALVLASACVPSVSAQTWSLTGGNGNWQAPSSMQPLPFTSRGSWVSMPFVVQGQPWVHAQGGNRPFEREAPQRFQPKPAPPVPAPVPQPAPSAIDPNATYPTAPDRGSRPSSMPRTENANGMQPQSSADADGVSVSTGSISLPTTSGVSMSGGPIGVNMGTNWGWGASSAVHRDASTGYPVGWNQPGASYGAFDPRLSVHYKPAEIAAARERERLEDAEAKRSYLDRGMSALAKGDLELAEQLLSEHLRGTPEDVALARTIGVIELLLKRTDLGVKRIASAYTADPLLCETPIDLRAFPGGTTQIRRAASDVATLATKPGRADAALVAAALAQARGDRAVAMRFLERAAAGGLEQTLVARFRGTLAPPDQSAGLDSRPGKK